MSSELVLERDGAQLFEAVLTPDELEQLSLAIAPIDRGEPGHRLASLGPIARWVATGSAAGQIATKLIGPEAVAVRAILFDKNPSANWTLGWHQDRTIAVEARADLSGFGPWTVKGGIPHVEPPFAMIERMLTMRLHLDSVDEDNAPLLISPGTHLLGKLSEAQLAGAVEDHGVRQCLAKAGDVWVYRTPIVHASARSVSNRRRRVLQIDYSAEQLPPPLHWYFSG